MATLNFYLHEPGSSKATSIMLHFLHNNAKLIYSTGQKIHPKDWNKTKQRAKNSLNQASVLNELLNKIEDETFNSYRQCLLDSNSNFKEAIKNHLDETIKGKNSRNSLESLPEFNSIYFVDYLDLMINESKTGIRIQSNGKRIADDTFRGYSTLRYNLIKYEKYAAKRVCIVLQTGMNLTEIKELKQYWMKWYAEFLEFLYSECDLYDNAVGSIIKSFKTLWNYIREHKCKDIGTFQKDFRTFKENIQVIALEPHQLSELINNTNIYNSLPVYLQKAKDIFLFGCTVGLRIKDLKALTHDNLRKVNDSIYLVNTSSKTNTETSVKLPQYCIEIITKYQETQKQLLPICSIQKFNDYIKDVCKAYGFDQPVVKRRERRGKKVTLYKNDKTEEHHKFYELVSTHTMRRTAITSLLRLGTAERVVKSISGHANGSRDFDRYIAYSQQFNDEISDAAFEKLYDKR